jgi:haloalkane dehalogenase
MCIAVECALLGTRRQENAVANDNTGTAATFVPSPTLYPFTSRYLHHRGAQVHYVDEGHGRPVLFLHGNPTWSFLYRNIIRCLSDRFRCVALDYPGFGLSDRPTDYGYTPAEHVEVVVALAQHLDLRDLIIFGQDWGGPIGIGAALALNDCVSGLAFGNTWFWPTDWWMTRVFAGVMSSGIMQRAILERNYFVERLIPAGTARQLSVEEMDHYRRVQPDAASRRGVAEFPRQLVAAKPWLGSIAARVPAELGKKPLLLTWGMRDLAFPPKQFISRWMETFADTRIVELPRAKHFIQEDAPEAIADNIRARFA